MLNAQGIRQTGEVKTAVVYLSNSELFLGIRKKIKTGKGVLLQIQKRRRRNHNKKSQARKSKVLLVSINCTYQQSNIMN